MFEKKLMGHKSSNGDTFDKRCEKFFKLIKIWKILKSRRKYFIWRKQWIKCSDLTFG